MQDDLYGKAPRRHVKELNIVPILDMMTTVIFFLLLSTSFIEFTKITVPPSSVSTITDPVTPPPLAPRIVVMKKAGGYRIQLSWSGMKSGALTDTYKPEGNENFDTDAITLLKKTEKLVSTFRTTYPSEKNFQLGLSSQVPYQFLVAVMDGAQMGFSPPPAKDAPAKVDPINIVLVSYAEVDSETVKSGDEL